MNSGNLIITFLILIGILYLIYQSTRTTKVKKQQQMDNFDLKKERKVTFDLSNNKYHSYSVPSTTSTITENTSTDSIYRINSNSVSNIPNTLVELPTEYALYESDDNVSFPNILKNTNTPTTEYQTSICLDNSRYNGDIFNYENDKGICSHIPTTNEKVDMFRKNSNMYLGNSVADVYNNITKSEYKKDRKELTTQDKFYSNGDNGRKTLKPDRWGYKNEFSMNGGIYKGDIYGYDPMTDKQLAI